MKCEIRWIDDYGTPTPDQNEAVMIAHTHESVWKYPSGAENNRIMGYSEKIVNSYPICAEHYARVTYNMRYPIGAWSFTPITK